jgi:hypothetical protein
MANDKKDQKNEKPAEVDNLQVEPLTDEDLESASGGTFDSPGVGFQDCSCTETGGNCTS